VPLFTKAFHDRKLPVWQDAGEWNSLGEVDARGYKAPPAGKPMAVEAGPKSLKTILEEESKLAAKGTTDSESSSFSNFILGLIFGIAAYLLYLNREKVIAMISSAKGGK
ncbi:MAG: hypothetical protein KAR12_05615, partial [Methylococcales bacterium]|nr:hypothetical protein [Methylococcales bacterium]